MGILFLKFIIIWITVGAVCTLVTIIHDIVFEKIKIKRCEVQGMIAMTLMGFVSVFVVAYFFSEEIREKRQCKTRRRKR